MTCSFTLFTVFTLFNSFKDISFSKCIMIYMQKKRKIGNENDDCDCDESNPLVTRLNNRIYFYEDVTKKSVFTLIEKIQEANEYVRYKQAEVQHDPVIYVHICSDGGCVYAGLSAMDTLKSNDIKITTIMEGAVCSAATFIALGGHTKFIRPNCDVLIHQIHSEFWGKYEEFKDEKETLDNLMKKIRTMYEDNTDIPKKTLDKLFQRNIYLNSSECIKWKIADELI